MADRLDEIEAESDRLNEALARSWSKTEACYILSITLGQVLDGEFPVDTTFLTLGMVLSSRLAIELANLENKETVN